MLELSRFTTTIFSDAYRQIVSSLTGVEEPQVEPYGIVREDLIRCLWFGGHHKRILTTEDGVRLEVLAPGWWNVEAGPDFRNAELMVERQGLVKGDVEIHVQAGDWTRHGHNTNPAYDGVVLHVFLRNDTTQQFAVNSQHEKIPQLALEKHLETDLAELSETISVDQYPEEADASKGLCGKRIEECGIDDAWLGQLLDYAGDERMLSKARRFQSALQAKPFDQVLYEGIMEVMGYKNNRAPFLQLARVVTLDYLRNRTAGVEDEAARAEAVQAALFGVANILPDPEAELEDEQPQTYAQRLWRLWEPMAGDFVRQVMDAEVWQLAGSRPTNYPARRIAAVSRLLARHAPEGLGRRVIECFETGSGPSDERRRARAVLRAIDALFTELHDPYWDSHYTFGGQASSSPKKLVGAERCATLVVNVFVPLLLQYAREHDDEDMEKRVHTVFCHCRKLADDQVTRFMATRLLGSGSRGRCAASARRQQGLHQICQDFCKREDAHCSQCVLMLAIDASPLSMRRGPQA